MSYILDALKKAERDRRRGKSYDFMSEHDKQEDAPKRRLWLYGVLVLLVAAAGSAGWFLGSDRVPGIPSQQRQAPQAAMNQAAQPASAIPPPAMPSPESSSAAPQAKVAETPSLPKTVAPASERHEVSERKAADTPRVNKDSVIKKTTPSKDLNRPPQAAQETTEQNVARKSAPGNRIYAISELPDEIRQGLPELSISTHIYSQDKSERLVSINGHIGREGQEITPGITLEAIVPDGAILRYQGYKFKIGLK